MKDEVQRIYGALQKRFSAPEWALLFEVANGTGARKRRSAYQPRGIARQRRALALPGQCAGGVGDS